MMTRFRYFIAGASLLLAILIVYEFFFTQRRAVDTVQIKDLTISTVARGVFQESIPQTGTIQPATTMYLDAVEGGTIKKVVAQSGDLVKPGDILIEMGNQNRELEVLQQEAQLNLSINRTQNTRLLITRNNLQQRLMLSEIEKQLQILGPQYTRQKQLFAKKLISKQEFEKTEADYNYNLKNWTITNEAYKRDSIERVFQLEQLDIAEAKMAQSLQQSNKILESLIIRAPIAGRFSRPQLDEGQNVAGGQRLGQVEMVGKYKVTVLIDELYLPRIAEGLKATATFDNQDIQLSIAYVYPTIENGRFKVDMNFSNEIPKRIRTGQSLRLKIDLGQSSEELLLPVGEFYKETGGNWIYVLNGRKEAVRKSIKLGRKNTTHFEILEGLTPGDSVITSSYGKLGESESVELD